MQNVMGFVELMKKMKRTSTWVREEDGPTITNVVMELEFAMGGLNFKVWDRVSYCNSWHFLSLSLFFSFL